jgi:acetyl-CoA C-acetyltransferase
MSVNRLCGSGLQAVISAAQQLQLGLCQAALAGGAESMSRAPYLLPAARFGQRMGDGQTLDLMVGALTCPINRYHMGITAENVAERYGISRAQQDALALESHRRAARAIAEGRFAGQVVPVELKTREGTRSFDTDERVRHDCTPEELAALRPAFKREGGTVTAGNASGLNDAAAALLLMDREYAEANGHQAMARLVDYQVSGVAPEIMGIGPVPAVRELLARNGLEIGDIDFFELNEAFAAQALAVMREWRFGEKDLDRTNPRGSGISLGHPVGATGTRMVGALARELHRREQRYGLATLCIGGGQGIAAVFERIA